MRDELFILFLWIIGMPLSYVYFKDWYKLGEWSYDDRIVSLAVASMSWLTLLSVHLFGTLTEKNNKPKW